MDPLKKEKRNVCENEREEENIPPGALSGLPEEVGDYIMFMGAMVWAALPTISRSASGSGTRPLSER